MSVEVGSTRIAGPESGGWTPARIFLATSAAYHLLLGIAGFAIDQSFPLTTSAAAHGAHQHVFGIFMTNGWHSLAGALLGIVSLWFAIRPRYAREAAIAIGVSQVATVVGLALLAPSTFLLASNGADQVIHAFTAIAGIACGLATPRSTLANT
ncbi:MAG: DUF4383 domain-containing protein [Actinomycetota bacterium]|nr:DUF4383 domain-containing protein [Actinomycetota bacterium]